MSAETPFTLLDDGQPWAVTARLADGRVRIRPGDVEAALGWTLTPEGLCRGDTCLRLPPGSPLVGPDGLDLAELAALVRRPLAVDLEEQTAYLGVAADRRAEALASRRAPDFTLPDLDGRLHTLSEYRGRKVFLVAYASW